MSTLDRIRLFIVCAALSLALVGVTLYWSVHSQREAFEDYAVKTARQVAVQVRGFTLYYRGKDKLRNAIERFNVAENDRAFSVHFARFRKDSQSDFVKGERYSYDHRKGELDYAKILIPDSGDGVRIFVETPYAGFFGTTTKASSDVLLTIVWLVFALCFYLIFKPRFFGMPEKQKKSYRRDEAKVVDEREEEKFPEVFIPSPQLHLKNWNDATKFALSDLARCVRDVVKQGQEIVNAGEEIRSRMQEFKVYFSENVASVKDIKTTVQKQDQQNETLLDMIRNLESGITSIHNEIDFMIQSHEQLDELKEGMSYKITSSMNAIQRQLNQLKELDSIIPGADPEPSAEISVFSVQSAAMTPDPGFDIEKHDSVFDDDEPGIQIKRVA